MAKTIKKISRRLMAVATATMLFAACAEETVGPGATAPISGMVIVDYTMDEALTRSVSHTALPANQRIKSLTYLLYDEAGQLVKQREVPDIDKMEEQGATWPMKRSTMTWEQREALKDTLLQGHVYTAVFIANANKALFNGEKVLHLTKTVDGQDVPAPLNETYLSLPRTTAFNDHNMFYLAVNKIPTKKISIDRDQPYDCPVMLKRIVSRTDFFSDDYPEWNSESEFTQECVRKISEGLYTQVMDQAKGSNKPFKIGDWVDNFAIAFNAYAHATTIYNLFGDAIQTYMTITLNYNDIFRYLENEGNDNINNIKDKFHLSCLSNNTLKSYWLPWKGLNAKIHYTRCADRFYVGTGKAGSESGEATSPLLDIVQMPEKDGKAGQHTFSLIGFGENDDATPGNEQNRMQEVLLYGAGNTETSVSALPLPAGVQSFVNQGCNDRIQLNYLPIKTVKYNHDKASQNISYRLGPIKMTNFFSEALLGFGKPSFDFLQTFFESDVTNPGKKYGTSIDDFYIEITLPDLSRPDALIVEPEWTVIDPANP